LGNQKQKIIYLIKFSTTKEKMVAVIICLVISMVLLFTSMVLSSMAASAASKNNSNNAHKYSMASAVVSGLSVFLLIVVLILYINAGRIANVAQGALNRAYPAA
jgi:hypothetical protein